MRHSKGRASVPPAAGREHAIADRARGPQTPQSLADVALGLQRTVGNQLTGQLLAGALVQPKLKVGAPGDRFEREADQIADQVMRSREADVVADQPALQQQPSAVTGVLARGAQEVSEATVPPKAAGFPPALRWRQLPGLESNTANDDTALGSVLPAPGRPLDPATRGFFEPRFGRDLSNVRIHDGARAGLAARGIGAQAFTLGRNIVFGPGRFAPRDSGRPAAPGPRARPCRATAEPGGAAQGGRRSRLLHWKSNRRSSPGDRPVL